jgi:hypothetical protein
LRAFPKNTFVSGPIESISYDPEKKAMVVRSRFSTDDRWTDEVVDGVVTSHPKNGLLDLALALDMEKNFQNSDPVQNKKEGLYGVESASSKTILGAMVYDVVEDFSQEINEFPCVLVDAVESPVACTTTKQDSDKCLWTSLDMHLFEQRWMTIGLHAKMDQGLEQVLNEFTVSMTMFFLK